MAQVDISKYLGRPSPLGIPSKAAAEPYGYLRGLGEEALFESGFASAFNKPSAMFLQDPDPRLAAWEAKYPKSDIATTLATLGGETLVGAGLGNLALRGAAKGVPMAARALRGVEALKAAPGLVRPALGYGAEMLAFEPAKLATAGALQATGLADPTGAA